MFCIVCTILLTASSCNKELIIDEEEEQEWVKDPDTVYIVETIVHVDTVYLPETSCIPDEHLVLDHPDDTRKYAIDVNNGIPFHNAPTGYQWFGFEVPYCPTSNLNEITSIKVIPCADTNLSTQSDNAFYVSEVFVTKKHDGDKEYRIRYSFPSGNARNGTAAFFIEVSAKQGMSARYWAKVIFA